MTQLVAPGTSALSSSDFTVSAGGSRLVFLTDADGGTLPSGTRVNIEVKDGSNYYVIDTLTDGKRAVLVSAPTSSDLTCRVSREANAASSVGAAYL